MQTPVSRRIGFIYETYYRKLLKERVRHVRDYAREFCEARFIPEIGSDKFQYDINIFCIYTAIESSLIDIIKYRDYHFNPKYNDIGSDSPISERFTTYLHQDHNVSSACDNDINLSKLAAFTAKWLINSKPIFIVNKKSHAPSPEEMRIISAVNERFVLDYVFIILDIVDGKTLNSQIINDMFYHLKYRTYDDRSLMLLFRLAHELAKKHKIQTI